VLIVLDLYITLDTKTVARQLQHKSLNSNKNRMYARHDVLSLCHSLYLYQCSSIFNPGTWTSIYT